MVISSSNRGLAYLIQEAPLMLIPSSPGQPRCPGPVHRSEGRSRGRSDVDRAVVIVDDGLPSRICAQRTHELRLFHPARDDDAHSALVEDRDRVWAASGDRQVVRPGVGRDELDPGVDRDRCRRGPSARATTPSAGRSRSGRPGRTTASRPSVIPARRIGEQSARAVPGIPTAPDREEDDDRDPEKRRRSRAFRWAPALRPDAPFTPAERSGATSPATAIGAAIDHQATPRSA